LLLVDVKVQKIRGKKWMLSFTEGELKWLKDPHFEGKDIYNVTKDLYLRYIYLSFFELSIQRILNFL